MTDGYTTPPQPQYPGAGPGGQPASVGQRFLARLIDHILFTVVVLVIVLGVVFGSIVGGDTNTTPFGTETNATSILASIVGTVLLIAYFAFLESSRGQTLGKMMLGLEVRAPGGGHPDLGTAVKRNAWLALGLIPVVGSVASLVAAIAIAVTISNSTNGSGWHDNFAGGTTVVKH
jgi:uncharacterized RDD family membrane protein YckC